MTEVKRVEPAPDGWLAGLHREAAVAALDGSAYSCGHGTLPLVYTPWNRSFRCLPCAVAADGALQEMDPAEDHTCDRCRRIVDDLDTLVSGEYPVVLAVGLCSSCFAVEVVDDAVG